MSSRKTVGIRVPGNNICLSLIRELGHPILNASVTDNAGEIVSEPEIIEKLYGKRVDLVLDGGSSLLQLSTILDLTDELPVIVREGAGDVSTLVFPQKKG